VSSRREETRNREQVDKRRREIASRFNERRREIASRFNERRREIPSVVRREETRNREWGPTRGDEEPR
jgi:hypothetical protein